MAKKRLINCDFFNSSAFKTSLSNKAKLLYFYLYANADDKGFVDSTTEIIETLTNCEQAFNQEVSLELLQNDFNAALGELMDRGLLYCFEGRHHNRVYLIRHWYLHNINLKSTWTNYTSYLNQGKVIDNKYIRKKEYKEYKEENRNNITQDSISNKEDTESWEDTLNELDKNKPKTEES